MVRVDFVLSVRTKLIQCIASLSAVNTDEISICPHFDADQHNVDVFLMIQLQRHAQNKL